MQQRELVVEEHYSTEELAARIGVSERTICEALQQGRTSRDSSGLRGIWPQVRLGSKCVRIPATAANRWLRAHQG